MSRLCVWTNDKNKLCYAGILKRYMLKISPGQERLFCKPATEKQIESFVTNGFYNAQMSPMQPLGITMIRDLFKMGAEMLGITNPTQFGGHALRSYFCTQLYNSPEVSCKEAMGAARHSSVSASITYIQRNNASEAGRMRALGQYDEEDTTNEIPVAIPLAIQATRTVYNPYAKSLFYAN